MAARKFLVSVTLVSIIAGSVGAPIESKVSADPVAASVPADAKLAGERIARSALNSGNSRASKSFLAPSGSKGAEGDAQPKNPYRIIDEARQARRTSGKYRMGDFQPTPEPYSSRGGYQRRQAWEGEEYGGMRRPDFQDEGNHEFPRSAHRARGLRRRPENNFRGPSHIPPSHRYGFQ